MARKKITMVECDSCNHLMTEAEFEDFPLCPECDGSCFTTVLVVCILKERRKSRKSRRKEDSRFILKQDLKGRL